MKKALIGYQGWVSQIRDPGEEHELYEGPGATSMWVDAPDDITLDWTLEWSPGQQKMIWVERDGPFTDHSVARKVAYGEYGAQLGMIFDAIKDNGVLDTNSEWFQHQLMVKSIIPKPSGDKFLMTNEEYIHAMAFTEPSADKQPVPSTMDIPSWVRYPGWKGYQAP
jgi:hypothetical protein